MGLLDGLLGQILGKSGQQAAGQGDQLSALVGQLIQDHGGVAGLVEKFSQSGLADLANSWVGKGANLPLQADQVTAALDSGALGELAGRFGMSSEQASKALAAFLPQAIDHLTPDGALPAAGQTASMDSVVSMLGGLLNKR